MTIIHLFYNRNRYNSLHLNDFYSLILKFKSESTFFFTFLNQKMLVTLVQLAHCTVITVKTNTGTHSLMLTLMTFTWSMTFALKIASSMCFSSDLITHLMLLTTCWTSGGRLQLECSRNLATKILVSLYILRSARECGRSWGECAWRDLDFKGMSVFLLSFCCFAACTWLSLSPITSVETPLGSEKRLKY